VPRVAVKASGALEPFGRPNAVGFESLMMFSSDVSQVTAARGENREGLLGSSDRDERLPALDLTIPRLTPCLCPETWRLVTACGARRPGGKSNQDVTGGGIQKDVTGGGTRQGLPTPSKRSLPRSCIRTAPPAGRKVHSIPREGQTLLGRAAPRVSPTSPDTSCHSSEDTRETDKRQAPTRNCLSGIWKRMSEI
jgi:hypothetical protein